MATRVSPSTATTPDSRPDSAAHTVYIYAKPRHSFDAVDYIEVAVDPDDGHASGGKVQVRRVGLFDDL